MNYLAAEEYENYGIEGTTPASWVGAASSLIDAHCRRTTLATLQYVERKRLTPGRNCVQLTFLPLAASSPLVSARGRYATPRRGEDLTTWDMGQEVAMAFSLPGTWIDIDVARMDSCAETGEVSWLANPRGRRGHVAAGSPWPALSQQGPAHRQRGGGRLCRIGISVPHSGFGVANIDRKSVV